MQFVHIGKFCLLSWHPFWRSLIIDRKTSRDDVRLALHMGSHGDDRFGWFGAFADLPTWNFETINRESATQVKTKMRGTELHELLLSHTMVAMLCFLQVI